MESNSATQMSNNNRLDKQNILVLSSDSNGFLNRNTKMYSDFVSKTFNKSILIENRFKFINSKALSEYCENTEIVYLIFSVSSEPKAKNEIKLGLRLCRELRIPYLFVKDYVTISNNFTKVLAPITFLPEEKEKAPWSTSFGKHGDLKTILVKPNDKGTRAAKNLVFVEKLLKIEWCKYEILYGKKGSFKNTREIVKLAETNNVCLIMYSSSRAYGLDDIVFGPYEQNLILQSNIPVMLINPRDDLYILCGA